ncbi:DAN domain family member 5-like isoform X1 [Dendrobates tinctorius]|uniref:DAN domain family member 5-like isoform X1 n=1 Tax=Dendrobates tinctorius TaxID=92724 RepID=UPI003CC9824B
MLLLLVIVAASSVNSAPFLKDEGSAYISVEPNHGRRQETSDRRAVGEGRRSKTDSFRAAARVPLKDHMDEGARQRKMVWESAIRRERPTSRPDTVLPIGRDALTRSSCNALPFIQNVFRKSCAPLKLPNKFCFGQCNSFYVPGLPPGLSRPCTSCAPTRSRRISVPLRCRGGRLSWEEVVLVEECACDAPELGQVGSGEGFLPVT